MTRTDPRADFLCFRRAGDAGALARVFDALAPELLLLAAHLAPERSSAEDLVQTTFLQAMRDAQRYDGARPLAAWLAGILAHRAADERRRSRTQALVGIDPAAAAAAPDDALGELVEAEQAAHILGVIEQLDEPYREVLVLRTAHGLTATEIAHALGRTPGTVRMQLQRAREKLKERLPRGLALPAVFASDAGRGLAGIRAELLAHAGKAAVAPGGALAGKLVAAAACLAVAGAFVLLRGRDAEMQAPADPPRVVAARASEEIVLAAAAAAVQDQEPPAAAREPVAALPAAPAKIPALSGVVLGLDGAPVPFARVLALDPREPALLRDIATADGAGRFMLDEIEPGARLGARASGLQPSAFGGKRGVPPLRPSGTRPQTLVLRLGAGGNRCAGRVLLPDGSAVAGALVALAFDEDTRRVPAGAPPRRRGTDREAFTLVCDAEGRFATDEAPAGEALLVARDPALGLVAWQLVDVRAAGGNSYEVRLREGGEVRGKVTDRQGRPIGDLELEAEWKGTDELGEMEDGLGPLAAGVRARTAADGSYRLTGLLPGEHELVVRAGAKRLASRRLELGPDARERWNAEVEAQAPLAVRVLGPDGEPLAGWGLKWSTGERARDGEIERAFPFAVALDKEGRFRIEALDFREHVLRFFPPPDAGSSFSSVACAARAGISPAPEELVVRLRADEMPSGLVRGRWIDARGRPVTNARVQLEQDGGYVALVPLGADGAFLLERLPPGPFLLRGNAREHYPPDSELARFELRAGEARDLGTLALPDPAQLVIEPYADDGLPLGELDVELVVGPDGGGVRAEERTGSFRSRWLWPGEYEVLVEGAEIAPTRQRVVVGPAGETFVRVACRRSREVVLDVVLLHEGRLEDPRYAGGGRIDVEVRDPAGATVLHARDWKRFHDERARIVRFPVRLAPGSYRAKVVDHTWEREGSAPRPWAEVALEVPATGEAAPVRVEIR